LQERSLKVSGSKSELIKRLVDADRTGMESITVKSKIMKCSVAAVEIVALFDERKEQACEKAMQNSFDALMDSDPKQAYKAYVTYQRTFLTQEYSSNSYEVERLKWILEGRPEALSAVSTRDLVVLRAAAAMRTLWRQEAPESWLPADFQTGPIDNRVAINYLLANARIKEDLARYKDYAKQVKIVFHAGDIDSCELCQSLDGKVIDIAAMPELPMMGCTSITGCQCHIESIFDHGVYLAEEDADTLSDDILEEESNPLESLRQLRQMLDEDLITQDEYSKKKAEILLRL